MSLRPALEASPTKAPAPPSRGLSHSKAAADSGVAAVPAAAPRLQCFARAATAVAVATWPCRGWWQRTAKRASLTDACLKASTSAQRVPSIDSSPLFDAPSPPPPATPHQSSLVSASVSETRNNHTNTSHYAGRISLSGIVPLLLPVVHSQCIVKTGKWLLSARPNRSPADSSHTAGRHRTRPFPSWPRPGSASMLAACGARVSFTRRIPGGGQ